jgi:hypothetical protein
VRRRSGASVASIAHSSKPVPAAISDASVKVGMYSRQANSSAAPNEQYRPTAAAPPKGPSHRRAPMNTPAPPSAP